MATPHVGRLWGGWLAGCAMLFAGVACQEQVIGAPCTGATCADAGPVTDPEPPRLYIDPPFGVGFECVALGCDTRRTLRIENRGGGAAVVVLTRLSVDSSTEFALRRGAASDAGEASEDEPASEPAPADGMPTETTPLRLRRGEGVDFHVRYVPTDADIDEGALWVDWYDGAVAYAEAVVERATVPISTRVLGAPTAEPGPEVVELGYVPVGERHEAELSVRNASVGDGILEVGPAVFAPPSDAAFTLLDNEGPLFINPGALGQLRVSFAPAEARAYEARVLAGTNDGARPQLSYTILATAIPDASPRVVEPADSTLDFGSLRVGDERTLRVLVRNEGGSPLDWQLVLSGDAAAFHVSVPLNTPQSPLAPLQEVAIDVTARPESGADFSATLRLVTPAAEEAGTQAPEVAVALRVQGLYPDANIAPTRLDFGDIVQFWTTEARSISIANGGNGDLTIERIQWELGSSSQLRLASLPTLPVKLRSDDQPLEIAIYVEAGSLGIVSGTLLVHTDAIREPIRSVPVSARVVTCAEGCPVAQGSPTCNSGSCQVGSCQTGYHNTDSAFANGCECPEDTISGSLRDIGRTCDRGLDVGPLADNCGSGNRGWVVREGTLHTGSDEDLYFFRAVDGGDLFCDTFGDSFRARVQLDAPPPGVEFCIRAASAGSNCGGENQRQCGLTSWSDDGGFLGGDDLDVTVWVRRTPGSAPMCGAYRIRFSANENN